MNATPSIQYEAVIDPALTTGDVASDVGNTSIDEKLLKKTWLNLLPSEQVIEILIKLDEHAPVHVRSDVWPKDLRNAVINAAVSTIAQSNDAGKDAVHDVLKALGLQTILDQQNMASGKEQPEASGLSVTTEIPTTSAAELASPSTSPATISLSGASPAPISSTPTTAAVPPLTSTMLPPQPATSTTSYQAASTSYSFAYPFTSGTYSYQHSQPYTAPSSTSPAPPSASRNVSLNESLPPVDEDDLPSYEEMIVQALMVHNDPTGTQPKQLFQWMAATYPLQANFRPSASQALQKAFKRGRFEKSKDGRYRLNARWEGGNTAKRTTRRPQSYSKAVTNPSPSSHPPANPSQYLPQHYAWTHANRHSQSHSPAPPPSAPPAEIILDSNDNNQDSHRSCMEAAYNILQALNVTSQYGVSASKSTEVQKTGEHSKTPARVALPVTETTLAATLESVQIETGKLDTESIPLPVFSNDFNIPHSSSTQAQQSASNTAPSTLEMPSDSATSRAALQGSLALLAAQLAEVASSTEDSCDTNRPLEASTSASASSALSILENIGLDMFGSSGWAGMRDAGIDVERNDDT